jgi:hypothetical protein
MYTDCCSILLYDTVDRSIFNNYFMLNKHIGLSSCSVLTTLPLVKLLVQLNLNISLSL